MPLTHNDISEYLRGSVSTQKYDSTTIIRGVEFVTLNVMNDDGGTFLEIGRLDEAGVFRGMADFRARQVNYSLMEPGTVKAWHLHYRQDDIFFVPPDSRVVLGLVDCRKGSPTEDERMRLTLGGGNARLVRIPAGVAHGVANLTQERARLIYFVNQQFDMISPDEQRLPWDHFGAEFWERTKG